MNLDAPTPLGYLAAALFGLLLGGLLNLLIIRIPRERGLWGTPHCTRSGQRLRWWQLVPLLGWLLQRGRAPNGKRISLFYPAIELLTATMVVGLYARYGTSLLTVYLVWVSAVLIITGGIDWIHRYIYTMVILGSALLALLLSPFIPGMNILNAGTGALAGGIAFLLLFLLAKLLFPGTAAPFGMGDVYLAIFMGAGLGLVRLLPAIFYGMLAAGLVAIGIIVLRSMGKKTPKYLPYGSYLCLGALATLLLKAW